MSYFTETFEGILEFKGDANARDLQNKLSGDHKIGKAVNKKGQNYGSEDVRSMKDKRNHDAMEKGAKEALSGSRKDTMKKSVDMAKDASAGKYGEYGKRVSKESYDPVYEDLCRMGIID